jgi:hypothetical protein
LKKKNSGNGVLSSFTDGKATLDVVAIQYVDEEYTFPRTSLLKPANEREDIEEKEGTLLHYGPGRPQSGRGNRTNASREAAVPRV